MSLYKYSLLICVAVATSHAVQAGECEDHCDAYRPKGTNGPYTLDCSKVAGNRTQCGLKCDSCISICTVGAPEQKKMRCGPSSPNRAQARDFDSDRDKHIREFERNREKNHREFERDRDNAFQGFIIFYIIAGVVVLGLCIGVPACIFCCVQANRNRYPIVPMMHAPGAVYPTATYAPVATMYGGGAIMTTRAYPNQVAKSKDPTVEVEAEIGGGGSNTST